MQHLGDFPTSGKVFILWNTGGQDGASITRSTDGTLKIFKGNVTHATWVVERSSLSGVVQTEDFDATGIHAISIDLSDNTDAGFYAAGNEYQVAIVGAVVDGKTINMFIASFSIERANATLALLKDATNGLTAIKNAINTIDDFLDTEIAAIKAQTDLLPSDPADQSLIIAATDAIKTDTAAIKLKTDNLPSDPADESLVIAATDAIFNRIGAPVAASISADIATRATPAQVNTEVVDVLTVDTIAELAQAIPAATPTFATALMLMYMALRNKIITDTDLKVHNDAGTVITKKAVSDSGTVYTETEMVSGP